MAAGKAQIGKLAPDFTAKAVMQDGQFKDLKLSDYRGIPQPASHLWRTCFDDALSWTVIHRFVITRHIEQTFICTTED